MITLQEIKENKQTADDFEETEKIKKHISELKKIRKPLYLDKNDLERILIWKLRSQYGRGAKIRQDNTDDVIRSVTQLALNITHENERYETTLRLNLLSCLRGINTPIASAILTLTYPEKYAVIDFRNWRQLFDEDKRSFSMREYIVYLGKIKEFAKELGWTPQEVDIAVWSHDSKVNPQF